jgi:uridine kinase
MNQFSQLQLNDLLADISNLAHARSIITIDGNAGAGKTTLAKQISDYLKSKNRSCQIVNMDDLYEGWQNPFTIELANRVSSQVLLPFNRGDESNYQVFNWHINKFDQFKSLKISDFLLLEGVGSGQSAFRNLIDYLIWIEIDPLIGLQRVIARDGSQNSQEMQRFLTDQAAHFSIEQSKTAADRVLISVP